MIEKKSIFVVAGKGGTGKTTISGLLLKYLTQNSNKPVLAIDADPAACLGGLLGIEVEETLGDIRENAAEDPATISSGMSKHEYFDYKIQSSIAESGKIDLLTMGKPEGPGCYCYVNSIVRKCVDTLSSKYDFVVIDCEAGLEHISRRTTVNIDCLFLISNISVKGVKVADEIIRLVESLKTTAKKKILIFNRVRDKEDEELISRLVNKYIDTKDIDLIGKIVEDKGILEMEMNEESILVLPDNSPGFVSFLDIIKEI
ncbi:AAA family ATPase [candidate division KSB1 bacterium]